MVKSYLRYSLSSTLGVIVSPNSNVLSTSPVISTANKSARSQPTLAIVPALESIKVWNIKTSALLVTLYDSPSAAEVTVLAQNPVRKEFLAAGYMDGSIRLWKLNGSCNEGELVVTFNGHKSAITQLCFDHQGNRLASGSRDTDVVLWDIVSEEGIARLRSHQDQITGLSFLHSIHDASEETRVGGEFLLSAGKDGLVKVWDLTTNFCIERHLPHRGEIWALAVSVAQDVVVTAGPDGELKFWSATLPGASDMDVDGLKILAQRGSISRANRDRPLSLKFHPTSRYLAVHASSRNIEIFRLRSAEEVKKLLQRKRKRKSSKKGTADGEDHEEIDENSIANEIVAYTTIRTPAKVRSIDWESGVSSTSVQVNPYRTLSNVSSLLPSSRIQCFYITFRNPLQSQNCLSSLNRHWHPQSFCLVTDRRFGHLQFHLMMRCFSPLVKTARKFGILVQGVSSVVGIADLPCAAHFFLEIRLL